MVERGLAKYAVGQLERGSESGRLHLQYFVQMERSRRLAHMRTVICDRSHWEPMYGSVAQARAYATKEDTRVEGPWEFGLMSSVGKRRDAPRGGRGLCEGRDVPLQGGRGVLPGLGSPWPRPDVPAPAAEARRGPLLLRARGPGGMGAMGAFRDGEEPFRSSPLARRLLEGAGEQVVGRLLGQETVVLDDFKDYAMPLVELQRLLTGTLWVEVKGGACR